MSEHCERARAWASYELDGELSEFERALLQAHVAHCASCSDFRTSIAAITKQLRSTALEAPERRIAIKRLRRRVPRLAPAAVAAMAVAAVGLGSLLASSEVRNGAPIGGSRSSSSDLSVANPGTSPASGPTSLRFAVARRLDAPLPTVNTAQIQRRATGGLVLK